MPTTSSLDEVEYADSVSNGRHYGVAVFRKQDVALDTTPISSASWISPTMIALDASRPHLLVDCPAEIGELKVTLDHGLQWVLSEFMQELARIMMARITMATDKEYNDERQNLLTKCIF